MGARALISWVPDATRPGQGMLRMFYDNKSTFSVCVFILS